jgi:hypothetical protein
MAAASTATSTTTTTTGWKVTSLVTLSGVLGSAAAAVYYCYSTRRVRASAAAEAHGRTVRRQPLGAKATDALLSSWRAAHLAGRHAGDDALLRLTPDELAAKQYGLSSRYSLVLAFRDNSGCSPDPKAAAAAGELLLDRMVTDARELLVAADRGTTEHPPSDRWAVNDSVRAGGGAEKLCAAALALHGVCECAIEEFVQASSSYDDTREFWASLAVSPWLLSAYSFVYRTARSKSRAHELEQELRGYVDECALCAGSLQLFLESVAAAVHRHNKAAYTHTGDASAVVVKRDQAKLRNDLAAAILELRHCFPDELHRASGETIDDADATAWTECWCMEASAVVDAITTRHRGLIAGTRAAKFSTGSYHWRNLLLLGGASLVLFGGAARSLGGSSGGAEGGAAAGFRVRQRMVSGMESGREFFVLHLQTPVQHICTELLQGAGASKKKLATAPLVDASAAALEDLLAAWRTGHLEAVSKAKGAAVAAELAKLPAEKLAALSYQEQCLTPLSSALRGSLVELLMVQKEQMQLDVLRTLGKTDELMRANQMNMEVSALAPALLGIFAIGAWRHTQKRTACLRACARVSHGCVRLHFTVCGGTGYGVLTVYQWVAGWIGSLLPHSRHENSRAVELRWFAKALRRLDHSYLCVSTALVLCALCATMYREGLVSELVCKMSMLYRVRRVCALCRRRLRIAGWEDRLRQSAGGLGSGLGGSCSS